MKDAGGDAGEMQLRSISDADARKMQSRCKIDAGRGSGDSGEMQGYAGKMQ